MEKEKTNKSKQAENRRSAKGKAMVKLGEARRGTDREIALQWVSGAVLTPGLKNYTTANASLL